MRGATTRTSDVVTEAEFQSTRPMRGATGRTLTALQPDGTFQSTRPMRGATSDPATRFINVAFQSTRPMRGATQRQL